jgi:hypothetical protein
VEASALTRAGEAPTATEMSSVKTGRSFMCGSQTSF